MVMALNIQVCSTINQNSIWDEMISMHMLNKIPQVNQIIVCQGLFFINIRLIISHLTKKKEKIYKNIPFNMLNTAQGMVDEMCLGLFYVIRLLSLAYVRVFARY